MLFTVDFEKFLMEGVIFLTYILICGSLIERRFSKRATALAAAGTAAAVVLIQTAMLFSGQDTTFVLTLLPLTAYLPATVCLHVLSRAGFYQTAAAWTVGVIGCFILQDVRKLLPIEFGAHLGRGLELMVFLCVLILSALILFLVVRYLRKPFQIYVFNNRNGWLLLCFPVLMVFLLFSYFSNSTTNPTTLLLLLLTAFAVFLVLIRALTSAFAVTKMQEAEKAVSLQMQLQRREYEDLRRRIEAGRAYRHDMRHHLLILEELAKQGNAVNVVEYIENLTGQLSGIEGTSYCEDPTINAVLSSCVGRAKEAHCAVTARADLTGELPFDPVDVGIILANAIENAVHACEKIEQSRRYIRVSVALEENGRLSVSVDNPCAAPPVFDADGFPAAEKRDGHGIGLKSIRAISEKYNGVSCCRFKEGEFQLRTVLFSRAGSKDAAEAQAQRAPRKGMRLRKAGAYLTLILISCFVFINCMPPIAEALAEVPGLGAVVRLADVREYSGGWGDTELKAEVPVIKAEELQPDAPPAQVQPSKEPAHAENETPVQTSEQPEKTGLDGVEFSQGGFSFEAGPSGTMPVKSEKPSVGTAAPEGSQTTAPVPSEKPSAEGEKPSAGTAVPEDSQTPVPTPSEKPSAEGEKPSAGTAAPEDSQTSRPAPSEKPSSGPENPETPAPSGDLEDAVEDMNQQMEQYVAEMREKFLWYVARKYDGYVGQDTVYQVVRDDEALFSVRFETTINAGGSGQYSRYFTLDKKAGKVLDLWDLFVENSGYVERISQEVLRQMTEQVQAGTGDYFIPGGIWSEDECFQEIAEDQCFYINAENKLVIVFEEYEVAPGSMGMPEFVIPTETVEDILRQPAAVS